MKIYISNLHHTIKDIDILKVFAKYGSVSSVKVIIDQDTGKSRGFGFVEMPEDKEAKKAIQELNGASYEGETIIVKKVVVKPENKVSHSNSQNNKKRR